MIFLGCLGLGVAVALLVCVIQACIAKRFSFTVFVGTAFCTAALNCVMAIAGGKSAPSLGMTISLLAGIDFVGLLVFVVFLAAVWADGKK